MIIRRLQSENILRFEKLDLDDLPARGGILITGPNESGKSAILETLCLALFGRTVQLAPEAIAAAIHWGADQGSVTLDFVGPDQIPHTLRRQLDRQGNQEATLTRDGKLLASGIEAVDRAMRPIIGCDFSGYLDTLYQAQGRHGRPNGTIQTLAGVTLLQELGTALDAENHSLARQIETRQAEQAGLREALTSLNLREATLGEREAAHQRACSRIATANATLARWSGLEAGIAQAGQRIATACNGWISPSPEIDRTAWHNRGVALDSALREIESLGLTRHLDPVDPPATGLRQWHTDWTARLEELEKILATVEAERQRLLRWLGAAAPQPGDPATLAAERARLTNREQRAKKRHEQRKRRATGFVVLSLGGWFATLVVWQKIIQDHLPGWVSASLDNALPFLNRAPNLLLLYTAVALTLLVLWNLTARGFVGNRLRKAVAGKERLDQQAATAWQTIDTIDSAAGLSLKKQVEQLLALENTPWRDDLKHWSQGAGAPLLDDARLTAETGLLAERLHIFAGEQNRLRERIATRLLTAGQEQADRQAEAVMAAAAVADEQARRREQNRLNAALAAHEAQNRQDRHAIGIRTLAKELLQGASGTLHTLFVEELNRVMAELVPVVTRGRYHTPRFDDALQGEIQATHRNEPVPLTALSTGVRRQVSLALRLALCQALIARAGGDGSSPRFIALDEPLAYSDRKRGRESLEALLALDGPLTQIWVAAPEMEADLLAASRHIPCTPDQPQS
ncbi:MAG: AAA family ATPase [Magnetococcales bacterium]|nr:AAA family ATPase [Magnetococcales bacterium]